METPTFLTPRPFTPQEQDLLADQHIREEHEGRERMRADLLEEAGGDPSKVRVHASRRV
jgi:hypothetical protein